jgi:hypothetical protein
MFIVARENKNKSLFYWTHSLRPQKKESIKAFLKSYSDNYTWEECREKWGWKCIKVTITPA